MAWRPPSTSPELHGIRDVAVLEKRLDRRRQYRAQYDHRALGLPARPTTRQFYEHSMKLWEGLTRALNFNVMFCQRGSLITRIPTPSSSTPLHRRGNVMRLDGIDAELLDREERAAPVPQLDYRRRCAFPDPRRALPTAQRHRAARRGRLGLRARRRRLGVDIIQGLRGHGLPASRRSRHRGHDARGTIASRESRARGRGQYQPRSCDGGPGGCPSKPTCCRRS